jgi:hypothetical protein
MTYNGWTPINRPSSIHAMMRTDVSTSNANISEKVRVFPILCQTLGRKPSLEVTNRVQSQSGSGNSAVLSHASSISSTAAQMNIGHSQQAGQLNGQTASGDKTTSQVSKASTRKESKEASRKSSKSRLKSGESCFRCRRLKVKCNLGMRCARCTKAGAECVRPH